MKMNWSMTTSELAALLNRREYGNEISAEEEKKAKDAGLVVVFGRSDDLMNFRGAIRDEVGCYNGGKTYLDGNGLISNSCDDDNCPYFEQLKKKSAMIEALWCDEPLISWTYKTEIPHSTLEIIEDGATYCRGLVFDLAIAILHCSQEVEV